MIINRAMRWKRKNVISATFAVDAEIADNWGAEKYVQNELSIIWFPQLRKEMERVGMKPRRYTIMITAEE